MICPECGLEMIVYQAGEDGEGYVCRNPRCPKYDQRLTPKQEESKQQ